MKKYLLFLCFGIVMSKVMQAQTPVFQWAEKTGTTAGPTTMICMVSDAAGNIYSLGAFAGTTDLDPGPGIDMVASPGLAGVYISKISSDGNLIWSKQFRGSPYATPTSLAIDSAGNVYVTGAYVDTVDFDPGPGEHVLMTPPNSEGYTYLLKLDTDGNFLWVDEICSSAANLYYHNYSTAITLAPNGDVIVAGAFFGPADFDPGTGSDSLTSLFATGEDLYLWKVDKDGNMLWTKQLTPSASYTGAYSLAVDNSNNILISGPLTGTMDADPGAGIHNLLCLSSSSYTCFFMKLDANGNYLWAHKLDNAGYNWQSKNWIDSAGNFYLGSYFTGTVDFDPGSGVHAHTATASNNGFILKLDSNASYLWCTQLPNVSKFTINQHGDVFTCGKSMSKCLSDGTLAWTITDSLATEISVDSSDNIYTTGRFFGTFDFDPGPGVYDLTGEGDAFYDVIYSAFYRKMRPGVLSADDIHETAGAPFYVYPNPNRGAFNVMANKDASFYLVNIAGQVVYQFKALRGVTTPIALPALSSGIYMLTDENGVSKKVIVQK